MKEPENIIYRYVPDDSEEQKLLMNIADEYVICLKKTANSELAVYGFYANRGEWIANPTNTGRLIKELLREIAQLRFTVLIEKTAKEAEAAGLTEEKINEILEEYEEADSLK